LQSTCPNCDKHDNIYVRSGGPSSADLPTCPECAEVVHDADCPLVGDGRPVDGGTLVCRECA